ncbi:hypothetical protein [Methylomonas koyamae]|uniref:Uncharacterized protein n=1 Tax=Methylomonas koyamae TaxID=702114 RepID=A0A291IEZ3_9GAMM|nr:hypothetical protein [Methylomonas koyamae]ATG88786.1 hypothetical protein MKLM6_0511 [Methylomonas koyamae]OAI30113.1 hypothetical protein A1356_22190 [Methylomonas koyamae]
MNGWRFALATLAMSPFAPVWNGLVHVLRLAAAETELQLLMRPANLKQSADHGAFFGLLDDLSQFLLYPIPGTLVLAWFGCGVVGFCGFGLLAYRLYRPRAAAKTQAI